jgi:hypothetical protein
MTQLCQKWVEVTFFVTNTESLGQNESGDRFSLLPPPLKLAPNLFSFLKIFRTDAAYPTGRVGNELPTLPVVKMQGCCNGSTLAFDSSKSGSQSRPKTALQSRLVIDLPTVDEFLIGTRRNISSF